MDGQHLTWARGSALKIFGVVAASILALVALILLLGPVIAGPWIDRMAREEIRRVGQERFSSSVEVQSVSVSVLPPSATLTGVVFRHKGRTDVPPLFKMERLEVHGGIGLFLSPRRAASVRMVGLEVVVPRRKNPQAARESDSGAPKDEINFATGEIIADGAKLHVLSKKPGREPLDFDLMYLRLHDVSLDQPMKYEARLQNPKPPGLIRSTGSFGPWNGDEPSLSPLQGEFLFTDADLSDFKGIAGKLRSEGKFKGILEEFEVDGKAEIPDFRLDISGNPVHLKTQYHAIVDGTNGDTRLEPVEAQFLHSKVYAKGAVEGQEGQKGKTVRLDVKVAQSRIEDMLRLAMKDDTPLLTGPLRFQTKFELPPSSAGGAVVDRLRLDGRFAIEDSKFRSDTLQDKIDSLSRKGKGEPENKSVDDVASDLSGRFALGGGTIRFGQLQFHVPGATVQLDGDYGLRSEALDFHGNLLLDAKISETTTGVKSFLLKMVDGLFSSKKGGAKVPIKIGGTREKPAFGIDAGKIIKR